MAIKGYWPLNGNSNDKSGNGYNGTDSNITYGQGIQNGSAVLNGTSASILTPQIAGINSTNPIIINAWIKTSSNSPQRIFALNTSNLGTANDSIVLAVSWTSLDPTTNHKAVFGLYDTTWTGNYAISSAIVDDGKWHMITGYCPSNGGYAYIYVDGVLSGQSPTTTAWQSFTTASWLIGKFYGNAEYFNGSIDEVGLYNNTLSPAYFKNEYAKAKGFF